MQIQASISVKEVADLYNAIIIGDENAVITGINEIHKVRPGDLMFVDNEKYFQKALSSAASVILVHQATECPPGKTLLVVAHPFKVYDALVRKYRQPKTITATIAETAFVHPSATIEPGVIIGNYARIGAYSYLQANVYIGDHTQVGDHVRIESGALIGTGAFYYKKEAGAFQRWTTGGRVVIENHVDIGAGSTIARGVSGDTIIGEGTKIDCQVHIGHGVEIGKNCLIAAQVGISGKTIIEDYVTIYGQAGLAQAIRIGAGATIGAKSGVSKNLEGGKLYLGYPAEEASGHYRQLAALRQLPAFMKEWWQKNK